MLTRKWKQNTLIVKLTDINFVSKTPLEVIFYMLYSRNTERFVLLLLQSFTFLLTLTYFILFFLNIICEFISKMLKYNAV